jgi:hypothetical protein
LAGKREERKERKRKRRENQKRSLDMSIAFLNCIFYEKIGRKNVELMDRERAGLPDGTYIFKPKTPIWVNFGGHRNRKS